MTTRAPQTLFSVGIDVGTSTTELVFTELTIGDTAAAGSVPQLRIVDKTVRYRSEIHVTPLRSAREIDGEKVRAIVAAEFRRAGMAPEQVATGAVIITGETARKENAREVLAALSGLAGEFVVATAGPALEGIIAGKGSGAAGESRRRGATVANLDIGGSTTNIALFENGEVVDTACFEIGARHVTFGAGGEVRSISEPMATLARSLGLEIRPGEVPETATLRRIAGRMAQLLAEALDLCPASALLPQMVTDKALDRHRPLDFIRFSGGVSDCLAARPGGDPFVYGDLGRFLGAALAEAQRGWPVPLLPGGETIWATVIGAGAHTVELSGSTIAVAPGALPLKNLPVLRLSAADEARPLAEWAEAIADKLAWFRAADGQQTPALAFEGSSRLGFAELQQLAAAIVAGMAPVIAEPAPLVVAVGRDLAKALGQALRARLPAGKELICIDGVRVADGDYLDIGRPLAGGRVVPAVVKTLLFND